MNERTFWDRCRRQPIDCWYRIGYVENGKFNSVCTFQNRFNYNSGISYGYFSIYTPLVSSSTFEVNNGGGCNLEYNNFRQGIYDFDKELSKVSRSYEFKCQGSVSRDFDDLLEYLQKEFPEHQLFKEFLA